MNYTPGPWYWKFKNWRGKPTLSPHVCGDVTEDGSTAVCVVVATATSGDIPEANARLIAAAPELLAACQAAIHDGIAGNRLLDGSLNHRMTPATIRLLYGAIAKATQQ